MSYALVVGLRRIFGFLHFFPFTFYVFTCVWCDLQFEMGKRFWCSGLWSWWFWTRTISQLQTLPSIFVFVKFSFHQSQDTVTEPLFDNNDSENEINTSANRGPPTNRAFSVTFFCQPRCELVLLGSAYFVVHNESRHCGAEHTDVEDQEAHQEPWCCQRVLLFFLRPCDLIEHLLS